MTRTITIWFALICFIFICRIPLAPAADMRLTEQKAREKKAALLEKLEQEKRAAEAAAEESRRRILSDRKALEAAVAEFEKKNRALEKENQKLAEKRDALVSEQRDLSAKLDEMDAVIRELVGNIRINARDLDGLVVQSFQTALTPDRGRWLNGLIDKSAYPGMDEVRAMVDLYFDEIRRSGEVRIQSGPIIDRAGREVTADVLLVGNFTAAYRFEGEAGFLSYSPEDRRFYAFANLPSWRTRHKIKDYMAGEAAFVPVDISRGGALRQLSHRTNFWGRIKRGGPIVWPIMGILFLAVVLFAERLIFLTRKNIDADQFMGEINGCILKNDWEACRSVCRRQKDGPLANIIAAGVKFRNMDRQDMENVLQESILREIPPMERFLSTLGMLAAIAPLLGLLGTVTGMINTFHVITYYGTGDPRMMSGGISEALVTTMLGLMVAIPIMFGHTLLSRRVETMIAQMEEKAVSFINTVYKTKAEDPDDR